MPHLAVREHQHSSCNPAPSARHNPEAFMDSPHFGALLDRLSEHAEQHLRDSWFQCSGCGKVRFGRVGCQRLLPSGAAIFLTLAEPECFHAML